MSTMYKKEIDRIILDAEAVRKMDSRTIADEIVRIQLLIRRNGNNFYDLGDEERATEARRLTVYLSALYAGKKRLKRQSTASTP